VIELFVFANQFSNKSPEVSCLGEHGVALGAEKGSFFPGAPIPRRALESPY